MARIEDNLTHYQLCLAKAFILARRNGWAAVNLSQLLATALCAWAAAEPAPTVEAVVAAVAHAEVEAGGYRLVLFCDEHAVVFAPDGQQTDRVVGWRMGEGEGVQLDRQTDAPAWLTPMVLDLLRVAQRALPDLPLRGARPVAAARGHDGRCTVSTDPMAADYENPGAPYMVHWGWCHENWQSFPTFAEALRFYAEKNVGTWGASMTGDGAEESVEDGERVVSSGLTDAECEAIYECWPARATGVEPADEGAQAAATAAEARAGGPQSSGSAPPGTLGEAGRSGQ